MLVTGLTNCKSSKFTGQTTLLENTVSGQLAVKASGYGSGKGVSVKNAIENAFRNILLRGIPGSNQSTPLLGKNSEKTYKANKRFLDNMLENEINSFVLEQKNSKYNFFSINDPSSEVELLINLAALRSHLEQNGIIRAFGL
jgi:hypothetical protein